MADEKPISPAAAPTVTMQTPSGSIVEVDPGDVADATQLGYTTPTPEAIKAYDTNKKYNTLTGEAQAAAAGAARGASFGLSDLALTKSGLVAPQTLTDLQTVNPGASMLGEAAGTLVNPVLGPAGKLAEGAVGAALPEATTLAGRVLSGTASEAAGSAVQGALIGGVGNSVTEYALGDPELNGEKVASNFLEGGLLGGIAGGLLGAGKVAVPEAVSAGKDALQGLYSKVVGLPGEDAGLLTKGVAKAQSLFSNITPDEFIEKMQQRTADVAQMPEQGQKQFINDFADNLNDLYQNVSRTTGKVSAEIRPEENAQFLKDLPPETGAAQTSQIKQAFQDTVNAMKQDPTLYPPQVASKLSMLADKLGNRLVTAENAGEVFNTLNEIKGTLGKKADWGGLGYLRQFPEANSALQTLYGTIQKGLEDSDTWGMAASRQAAYNEAASQYLNAKKFFEKAFVGKGRGEVNPAKIEAFIRNSGSVRGQEALRSLTDYIESSKGVLDEAQKSYDSLPDREFNRAKLDDFFDKQAAYQAGVPDAQAALKAPKASSGGSIFSYGSGMGRTLEVGAILHNPLNAIPIVAAHAIGKVMSQPDRLITGLARVEGLVGKSTNTLSKAASRVFSAAEGQEGKIVGGYLQNHDVTAHQKLADRLLEVAGDPNNLIDHVTDNTKNLYQVAPQITGGVQKTAFRAAQFLSSKLPGNVASNQKTPFSAPYQPSQAEIAKFDRYRHIVENPMEALNQVRNGTLSPETIETLMAVYPRLYEEMKTQVLTAATKLPRKAQVPFSTQQSLSMFLGEPLNPSLTPQAIQANRAAIAAPIPQAPMPAHQPRASKTGMAKLSLAGRSATGFQATAMNRRPH